MELHIHARRCRLVGTSFVLFFWICMKQSGKDVNSGENMDSRDNSLGFYPIVHAVFN